MMKKRRLQKKFERRELVRSLGLDESDLASEYDYEYSDTPAHTSRDRNGEAFQWPAGWKKLGLDVSSRHNRIDRHGNEWLHRRDGWHVAFHGTSGDSPRTIRSIVRDGLKVRGGRDEARNGERYGKGVYCSPEADLAAHYAARDPLTIGNRIFEIVFMLRVRPGYFEERINTSIISQRRRVWIVRGGRNVRPCGILYREIDADDDSDSDSD